MPLDQIRIFCLGRCAPVDVFDTSLFDTLHQTTAHCDANESLRRRKARVDPQVIIIIIIMYEFQNDANRLL